MIATHQHGSLVSVTLAARDINPMSRLFQRDLAGLVDKLESQRHKLRGVVIAFHAEAAESDYELKHLLALTRAQAGDCMQMLGAYNGLLRRLETLGVPVIARLAGAVSGHAVGLVLACHRRLALDGASICLPQVQLGLAPVAGEIVRSVRLAGLQEAMPLLLEGAILNAEQARQAGLLHGIASSEAGLGALVEAVTGASAGDGGHASHVAHAVQPWDAKNFRLPGGGLEAPAVQALLQVAPAMLRERTGGHYPAPAAILCAMVDGLLVDFDSALLIESRYFCQAALSPVAKNLMRLSQLKLHSAAAAPAAEEFASTLQAANQREISALRDQGVTEVLLRNAARAAGLTLPPAGASPAQTAQTAGTGDGAAPERAVVGLDDARDRLLYALTIAALAGVARGLAINRDEADLISIRHCGFPAHTGGALHFIQHVGVAAFSRRAAALGARFALPLNWEA